MRYVSDHLQSGRRVWKIGLLEKVLEWEKNYMLIRNIERFCSTEAAFVKLMGRIMPYITTSAAD